MIALMTTQRSIAYVIATVIFVGGAAYALAQMRKGKAELGSEVELAPNRKQYFSDEELEGKKLNVALWSCVGLLSVIVLTLPFYWLAEPGRQEGAVHQWLEIFEHRGETRYIEGAQCVNCHGTAAVGGVASFVITDENGGYLDTVTWVAPALDNIFYKFSVEEVRYILTYGRPGTPMPAWGVEGGGPNTTQQLETVIEYLWHVQKTPEEVHGAIDEYVKNQNEDLYERMIANRELNEGVIDATSAEYTRMDKADERLLGEILFYADDATLGGNSFSCARCHVPGASFGKAWGDVAEIGKGSLGFQLIGIQHRLTENEQFNLVFNGTEADSSYGSVGIGTGKMPGFGVNPNDGSELDRRNFGPQGLLNREQIWAIVTYTRNLDLERSPLALRLTGDDVASDATLTEETER